MTVQEAERIIALTSSPYLKRDMQRFIRNQRRKEGRNGREKTANGCGACQRAKAPEQNRGGGAKGR